MKIKDSHYYLTIKFYLVLIKNYTVKCFINAYLILKILYKNEPYSREYFKDFCLGFSCICTFLGVIVNILFSNYFIAIVSFLLMVHSLSISYTGYFKYVKQRKLQNRRKLLQ